MASAYNACYYLIVLMITDRTLSMFHVHSFNKRVYMYSIVCICSCAKVDGVGGWVLLQLTLT